MKKLLLFCLLTVLSYFSNAQGGWRRGEMEVRVDLSTEEEARELAELHLNGDIYSLNGYALLYVVPEELEILTKNGFRCQVLKHDLNDFYKDFWKDRDAYHSYDEIIQLMNTLSLGHSSICKKYDLGLSVEGRLLSALKISDNVNVDEDEAEVMFDGGIHGDEIGGPENLIRFAQFLCDNYGTDPYVTSLIDDREIWLYVMVNPDGRVNMIRYNSNGIDLNRDWGYMWNAEGGSPGAYSQVETRTLRDCMHNNQFVVHTTYHSGTEFLSYPWSYRPDACPDQSHIDYFAAIYASTSGYSNLPYAQGYQGMYPINGSSKDAYYAVMGSIGWTMEISNDKQPPTSQIQYYYELNEPAMLATIENAGYGIRGVVTDAVSGEPLAATLFINNYYPCYTDPEVGDYHKYLLAGNYQVKAVANGYEAQTLNATVVNNTVTILDFALQPEFNHYAYKVVACAIPDNNFDDEGTTFAALWETDNVRYSLGRSGWIVLDMGEVVLNGPGEEIRVIEGDSDQEGYYCYAGPTVDGPWLSLGTGNGSGNFNFSDAGITEARYIRLEDDGNGPASGNDAGFDLDAVEMLMQPPVIYLITDARISDPAGNNNGRIDPGESCELIITLRNHGGLTAENIVAEINYDSTFVTFLDTDTVAGNLAFGEQAELSFPLNCSAFTPLEEIVMMVLNLSANEGDFTQSIPMHFTVGAIIEDWETNSFNKFDWTTSGNKPWVINFLVPYEGSYCAKSGNIDDFQTSGLEVTFEVIGYDDISFYRKASSEPGGDFLRFYIDGVKIDEWSGNLDWALVTYNVTPGVHTFKWTFEKNGTISQGYDGGYIDHIVFPSSNLDGSLHTIANAWPHEFCGQGISQLSAYVIGGTGNYSYSWTPTESLSNPNIQFPVADPLQTTAYQVTVSDGQGTSSSDILVTLHPVPEQPEVTQQGDSLLSSSPTGNQWYDSSGLIEGATGPVFYPEKEDYYHVIVTTGAGCVSEPSEPLYFLFTGLQEISGIEWMIYPNPFRDIIHIRSAEPLSQTLVISLADATGRILVETEIDGNTPAELNVQKLPKGVYMLTIVDKSGTKLHLRKMIR